MHLNKLATGLFSFPLILILTGSKDPAISYSSTSSLPTHTTSFVDVAQTSYLEKKARTITVKVSSEGEPWGSGVLVALQGGNYTVITNDHVVRSSKIQVTTFDGQVYSGKRLATLRPQGIDVALVQFQSSKAYAIATIGYPKNVSEGDFTFAAGYPLEIRNADKVTGLKMTAGNVTLKLEQPLRRGHQIGYTNEIERGMSGGPLLDINANLIGINAKHAYPIIRDSYIFQDNMLPLPCKPLKNLMFRSAWAVPIDVAINQAEKLTGLIFEHPHSKTEAPLVIGTGIPPVTIDSNKVHSQQKNWQKKNQMIETANLAKKCKG